MNETYEEKKQFLKMSQYSQENTYVGASYCIVWSEKMKKG